MCAIFPPLFIPKINCQIISTPPDILFYSSKTMIIPAYLGLLQSLKWRDFMYMIPLNDEFFPFLHKASVNVGLQIKLQIFFCNYIIKANIKNSSFPCRNSSRGLNTVLFLLCVAPKSYDLLFSPLMKAMGSISIHWAPRIQTHNAEVSWRILRVVIMALQMDGTLLLDFCSPSDSILFCRIIGTNYWMTS